MSKTSSTDSRRGTRRATPASRLPKPVQTEEERPSVKRAAEKKAAEKEAAKEKAAQEKEAKKDAAAEKAAEDKAAKKEHATKRAAEKSPETGHTAARDAAEAKAERGSLVSRLRANKALKRTLIAVVLVVAVLASLYAPVRAYYIAWRTELDLQARYEAILEDNEDIYDDLSRLRSREGIEDEARKRGYVNPGETSVVVRGLPSEGIDTGSNADEVVAEVPWYLVPLDALFGYEGI